MARKTPPAAAKNARKAAPAKARNASQRGAAKALAIEYWPLERLRPYERNPRRNDPAIPRIVESIKAFGFAVPILATSAGEIVDGHLRWKGAVAMKLATVPVIVCDAWTEAQRRAFRLMVNKSVSWADWDADALALEFAELKALKFDLTLTGFDALEYGDMSKVAQFEYDENAADDVKYIDCPKCGAHFPA